MSDVPDTVRAFLLSLLDREWAIKGSFESRATAMLSAHTATVAAALAAAALSGVEDELAEGAPLALNAISVALILISVSAALLVIRPADQSVVKVADLRDLIKSGSDEGIAETILDDLDIARSANKSKAIELAVSQFTFAVAVGAFLAALSIAL